MLPVMKPSSFPPVQQLAPMQQLHTTHDLIFFCRSKPSFCKTYHILILNAWWICPMKPEMAPTWLFRDLHQVWTLYDMERLNGASRYSIPTSPFQNLPTSPNGPKIGKIVSINYFTGYIDFKQCWWKGIVLHSSMHNIKCLAYPAPCSMNE